MGKTTENPSEAFAKQFYAWMEAAGFKNETQVAYKANVDAASLSRILKAERGMGPDVAKRVAKALGVDQIEFFRAYGLLDPPATPDPADPKAAQINRIMALAEQLSDADLEFIELFLRTKTDPDFTRKGNSASLGGISGKAHAAKLRGDK